MIGPIVCIVIGCKGKVCKMNYNFRGKRAELGVYDDAMGFTPEERETYHNMLVNHSFDTGLNIFDDKLWICGDDVVESVVPSPKILHDKITAERHAEMLVAVEEFLENHPLDKIIKINGSKFDNTE